VSDETQTALDETEPDELDPDELEVEDTEPDEEEHLSPEEAARRSAALAHVRKFGDPVLRTKARPVDRFDEALREEVQQMGELMTDAVGVGLAATQVGVLHRLLVYRAHPQAPVAALVNPVLDWSGSELESAEEGCLSLPAVHVEVERPVNIRVNAQNEHGAPITVEASGLEARVIQHEMDHLDGKLILDRTSRSERKQAMKALRAALGDG
jgi:peptide deformylase